MALLPLPVALPYGYDGPQPLTPGRMLTSWSPDAAVILGLVAVAGVYLWAATTLRRRGDAWSPWRDVAFVGGGLGTIAFATLAWPGTYDGTLFWAHMVQHMTLSMVAPIFLALGAPITLALRTLPLGPRKALMRLLHSRFAGTVLHPLVGFALLFGTPFALYFTGLYQLTLEHDTLHQLLHVHFLVAGCVFFWPIVGVDPVPGRLPHIMRLLVLFVTLPAHAWLGIAIMTSSTVLAGGYYRALGRPWGPSLMHDQSIGGGLLWATGDLVGLLVVSALFVQWSRADDREAVRTDRRLDRAGRLTARAAAADPEAAATAPVADDDAWAAYNAHLAALARRDATHP